MLVGAVDNKDFYNASLTFSDLYRIPLPWGYKNMSFLLALYHLILQGFPYTKNLLNSPHYKKSPQMSHQIQTSFSAVVIAAVLIFLTSHFIYKHVMIILVLNIWKMLFLAL